MLAPFLLCLLLLSALSQWLRINKYVMYKCLVWSELQYIGGVVHDHLSYKSVVFGAVICEIFYVNQACSSIYISINTPFIHTDQCIFVFAFLIRKEKKKKFFEIPKIYFIILRVPSEKRSPTCFNHDYWVMSVEWLPAQKKVVVSIIILNYTCVYVHT